MNYKPDIFYKPTQFINFEELKKDAVEKSYLILCEQKYNLTNKKFNRREFSKKSLKEILDIAEFKSTKFIHKQKNFEYEEEHFEVIFFKDWYMAWCSINLDNKQFFIDKYKLT